MKEGMRESSFVMGTRAMLKVIDDSKLTPFKPKTDKVYQKVISGDSSPVVVSLPLKI